MAKYRVFEGFYAGYFLNYIFKIFFFFHCSIDVNLRF